MLAQTIPNRLRFEIAEHGKPKVIAVVLQIGKAENTVFTRVFACHKRGPADRRDFGQRDRHIAEYTARHNALGVRHHPSLYHVTKQRVWDTIEPHYAGFLSLFLEKIECHTGVLDITEVL